MKLSHLDFLFFSPTALSALAAVVVAAGACTGVPQAHRHADDAGTDSGTDTGETDLPWDAGTDTDILVVEPVFLSEHGGSLSASFDGSHVAVSWPDELISESSEGVLFDTFLLSFPWESPEDNMIGSFAEEPPACKGAYTSTLPVSQPHPNPEGFLLLTAAWDNETDCEVVQTLWDHDANLLDGPHAFSGLFPNDTADPMDPHGIASDDGIVTTSSMNGEGFDTDSAADTEGEIIIDLDRWGSGGFHERLTQLSSAWPYVPTAISYQEVRTGWLDQTIFPHDGAFTVLGCEQAFAAGYSNAASDTILARIDADGGVVEPPARLAGDTPPVPAELELTTYRSSLYTFAASDDALLEVAKTMYMPLDGLADYDPSIADPYEDILWSRMIDFDGTPLTAWEQLAEYETHVTGSYAHVAWSGRYFAACYDEPFDAFKLIAMDGNGVPVSAPIRLFWSIPPVENLLLPCDVVAIDEDTFVAILGVYADPPQAYANGLYAVRVDVNIPVK